MTAEIAETSENTELISHGGTETRRFAVLIVLCVSAALWLTTSVSSARSVSSASQDRRADAEAFQLDRFNAMTRGDVDALQRMLADDLVYTHSSGRTDTKSTLVDSLRSGRLRYDSVQPRSVVVLRGTASAAIVSGEAAVRVKSDGSPAAFDIRFTEVDVLRHGEWQLAAWQSTRIGGRAPAPAEGDVASARTAVQLPEGITDAERGLVEAHRTLQTAFFAADLATLRRALDESWTMVMPNGEARTKRQVLSTLLPAMPPTLQDDLRVRIYGDVAVLTLRSVSAGRAPVMRVMTAWVRQPDGWRQIVQQQTLM